MARIEWVKHRLENWALWKERESKGGLGFASQSSFLNEAVADRYRESKIPVDEVDASLTNVAVESLRSGELELYITLQLKYVHRPALGPNDIARMRGVSVRSIAERVDRADHVIRQWFAARDEQRTQRLQSAN